MKPTGSRMSRFMARVLRHAPEDAGLTLDAAGWVSLRDLLRGLRAAGFTASIEDIKRVVAENDKARFTLSEDGQRIRAAQGHSVAVELGHAPSTPPDILYHGTATHVMGIILRDGLAPMKRQQVHLSAQIDTAVKVGARHGTPVILAVDAAAMVAAGHLFFQAENGVWLTDAVSPTFLSVHGFA